VKRNEFTLNLRFVGAWVPELNRAFEHVVLRFKKEVVISKVVVYETLTSSLSAVRIAAQLYPEKESNYQPPSAKPPGKKRKRARSPESPKRVIPSGPSPQLQPLDPTKWAVLWQGDLTDESIETYYKYPMRATKMRVSKFAPPLSNLKGVTSNVIRVDFDVRGEERWVQIDTVKLKGRTPQTTVPGRPTSVGESLLQLVGNKEFSDISIRLDDDSTTPAHKAILSARSEYFKAMLTGGMKESKDSEVHISELSKEVLDLLLGYLYTGACQCEGDLIVPLFVAADRFNMEHLRDFAVWMFTGHLTTENVLGLLKAVQEFPLLLEPCKAFVLRNYEVVALLPEFETLPQPILLSFIRNTLPLLSDSKSKKP